MEEKMNREGDKILPNDAILVKHLLNMDVYVSKSWGKLIIDVIDYHSGELFMSKEDLEEILKELR